MRPIALTLFVCTVAAQQAPPVLPGRFRVPLHTAPADPVRGAFGTWAVGNDYKASFHDGFRCYPRLGRRAPRNLPLAWRTNAVVSGNQPLFDRADRRGTVVGDWRYEFRHQGVVEAYELRADGVDQSFTVQSVPTASADLTVVGTIDSLLVPLAPAWQQAVAFADDGQVVRLTLGTARATDARGRAVPVDRTWDRGLLRLRVRAVDLAAVTFPVVFLQVVTPVELLQGNEYSAVDFARWDRDGYIVATSHWSAADADSHGFKLTGTWAMGVFWADDSADWSTERVRVNTGPGPSVGSSRVDLQACKLEYSIVSPK